MKRILCVFMCFVLVSCKNLNSNKDKIVVEKTQNKIAEYYKVEIDWEEKEVYDVKIDNKLVEKGETYTLESGNHSIRWIVPSLKLEISTTYKISNKPNEQESSNEFAGGVGINIKQFDLSKNSYIFINKYSLKILSMINVDVVPIEKDEKTDFKIFNTENNDSIEIIDKTKN